MAEQRTGGFGPDVLTLEHESDAESPSTVTPAESGALLLEAPRIALTPETDLEFYRRKQKLVAVRHVSDDQVVAVIEIVSPGNKSSKLAFEFFVNKSAELLSQEVHLLIVDLFPPSARDPHGIHGAIWEAICGEAYAGPSDKPLTLASYDAQAGVRAYVDHVAVGDALTPMPLFLKPRGHIEVPLERIYQQAFAAVPKRWQAVVAG